MRNNLLFISTFALFLMFSCNNKNKSTENNAHTSDSLNMEMTDDKSSMYLLVGTYTTGKSDGIYVYQFDTVSGFSKYKDMAEAVNPSYLTVSKDEKYVYAVSEVGGNDAAASAFSFDKSNGSLKHINTQPTKGADPCYITVDDTGKNVITANYSGGSVTHFRVNNDGSLSEAYQVFAYTGSGTDPDRQKKPHIHCVAFSPDGNYLFADDLGTDKIHKFNFKIGKEGNYLTKGTPEFFKVADASGSRHLTFHPTGKYAYLINEISGTVIAFDYDAVHGNLSEIQTVLADTLNARGSGDIHISPDGKFLYASNRLKGDGLAIFSIDVADGKLTKVGYQETGVHPRNFVITPNGKYLLVASRDNNIIQIFRRDEKTGLLENTYKDIVVDMPVCLKFVPFK